MRPAGACAPLALTCAVLACCAAPAGAEDEAPDSLLDCPPPMFADPDVTVITKVLSSLWCFFQVYIAIPILLGGPSCFSLMLAFNTFCGSALITHI